ncbi:MAG: acyl carrier protein [Planctomycetes bacterium]|nr:acyl carrier protein [Planctomycetota bacterium]
MDATRDKILEQITEVLVDALGVDEDEVLPEATLMEDLGAESIDFLDIVFRLEKAFDIKIEREELFPVETLMNDPALVQDNVLTDEGLALLKEKMGHSDITEFEKDPNVNRLGDLFTVNAVVNFVETRLR